MKILAWIKLLFKFLGLVKEAEELATAHDDQNPGKAPAAAAPRDETDRGDHFHLNQ